MIFPSHAGWGEPKAPGGCIGSTERSLAAIVAVLGVLAVPTAAPAKEISKVSVCGATGKCTTYDKSDFKSLMFLANDAGPTDPPAAAAPWYRLRFTVDERERGGGGVVRWTVAYVPSADSLRVRDQTGDFAWVALNPRAAAVVKRAVHDLPALPKARLRLQVEPLEVQPDEVFAPAAQTAETRERSNLGTTPWAWIGGGGLAAALVLVTIAWTTLRRRSHFEATPL